MPTSNETLHYVKRRAVMTERAALDRISAAVKAASPNSGFVPRRIRGAGVTLLGAREYAEIHARSLPGSMINDLPNDELTDAIRSELPLRHYAAITAQVEAISILGSCSEPQIVALLSHEQLDDENDRIATIAKKLGGVTFDPGRVHLTLGSIPEMPQSTTSLLPQYDVEMMKAILAAAPDSFSLGPTVVESISAAKVFAPRAS